MRGLTIILESTAPTRMCLAYEMALVNLALGARARIFYTSEAVARLSTPDPLRQEALVAGVTLIACQAALAESRLSLADCETQIIAGGLVSLMQELGDDRLIVV